MHECFFLSSFPNEGSRMLPKRWLVRTNVLWCPYLATQVFSNVSSSLSPCLFRVMPSFREGKDVSTNHSYESKIVLEGWEHRDASKLILVECRVVFLVLYYSVTLRRRSVSLSLPKTIRSLSCQTLLWRMLMEGRLWPQATAALTVGGQVSWGWTSWGCTSFCIWSKPSITICQ